MMSLSHLGSHSFFILASWGFGLAVIMMLIIRAWVMERAARHKLREVEKKS
jgi:heme exporter protein CcmD